MAVTNDDIFAWVRQSIVDLDGVLAAFDSLDAEELRQVADITLGCLARMVIAQQGELVSIDQQLATASPQEAYDLLWRSLAEDMTIAGRGLRRTLAEMEAEAKGD